MSALLSIPGPKMMECAEFEEPEDDELDIESSWHARFPVHTTAILGDLTTLRSLLASGARYDYTNDRVHIDILSVGLTHCL